LFGPCSIQPLSAAREHVNCGWRDKEDERCMAAETINQFWRHASSLPSRGTTGGLVHRQYIAATRAMTRRADTFQRAVVGTAHRREFENLIYPASYGEQERVNRNGRRTTRRGSGPGKSALFY